MTILRHNAVTNVGKVRKVNEDSILALPDQNTYVVADGMGGHAGGDFASQTVVESVAMIPLGLEPAAQMQALRRSILNAHALILTEIESRGGVTMGSAVVSLMISGEHFVCFWAGDCRDGEIDLLTSDHSIVAELVHAGQMTWDEAEKHPHSNAITRAVGVGDELDLDKIRGTLQSGDRFLLCSDGLNKYAGFDVLRRAMTDAPIETVSETLMAIALKGGGADNISIIVVDVL
jgi:serine/threonine-protein phosphatase Stp1